MRLSRSIRSTLVDARILWNSGGCLWGLTISMAIGKRRCRWCIEFREAGVDDSWVTLNWIFICLNSWGVNSLLRKSLSGRGMC